MSMGLDEEKEDKQEPHHTMIRLAPKSTASGSTGQHGPRFKRYRLPASGIKEVPDDVQMVTDVEQVPITQSI